MVAKWLGEMASSNTLRVMTLVPYGEPGNRLDRLREQLCHHMELALADRIKIKPVPLQFPESREALRRDLEYELCVSNCKRMKGNRLNNSCEGTLRGMMAKGGPFYG